MAESAIGAIVQAIGDSQEGNQNMSASIKQQLAECKTPYQYSMLDRKIDQGAYLTPSVKVSLTLSWEMLNSTQS